jgi:hypothetical protein
MGLVVMSVCLSTSGAEFLGCEAQQAAREDGDEGDLDKGDEVFLGRSKIVFNRR